MRITLTINVIQNKILRTLWRFVVLVNLINILISTHSFVIYLFSKLLPQIMQNFVEIPNDTIGRKPRLIGEEISKTVIKVSKDFIFENEEPMYILKMKKFLKTI